MKSVTRKMLPFVFAFPAMLIFSSPAFAPPIGFSGSPYPPPGGSVRRPSVATPRIISPPFMYDPDHALYDWKIKDGTPSQPCYYDDYYGQWVGNCNLYLTAPGYSITVPNRVR